MDELGLIQIWDYFGEPKKVRVSRKFEKLMVHSMSFDPKGDYLAVGFTNGTLKFLSAKNLKVRKRTEITF